MSYSCTDLADTALDAAAALAKVIGHAPPPDPTEYEESEPEESDDDENDDSEDFYQSPSLQADYILEVMDAAEAQLNEARAQRDAMATALRSLLAQVNAYDAAMDDDANDGQKARPPEGDDYNEIVLAVRATIAPLLD